MAYNVTNDYIQAIYSQDDRNDLKIWFNGVELENAGYYCEKITRVARILPNDGSKRFSLDNFFSTNLEVILHNVDMSVIKDQVEISIGTLVDTTNSTYEYVPLGVFNIQDTPENSSGKIVIKLRDNRVKFDFNYNGQPLMESLGGIAKRGQILDDICNIAGVVNAVGSFDGENEQETMFDSSISAIAYVSYLLEQGGYIPTIDRQGRLIKVDLSDLHTWRIPLSLVERNYEVSTKYKIERVVYESGIIKFETSNDETLDTLYLNSANPYITKQEQVDNILQKLQDFEIDSVLTKRVLGNPAIDPYDIIEVYNDRSQEQEVIFRTLANTTYTFTGVHRDLFDTQIGIEQRTENVSINSEANFQKYAKTLINNLKNDIELIVTETTQTQELNEERITELINKVNTVQQTLTSTQATIEVLERQIVEGQETLKNKLVTIDINGVSVSTNVSAISTLITNDHFIVRRGETNLTYLGYDPETDTTVAEMDNLTVTRYLVSGNHRREAIEIDGEKRTGEFYIGG